MLQESDVYLLGLGLALLVMKYFEVGPVAAWDWWVVLVPFALAVVWWVWADASGYTKRKAMERETLRQRARMARTREALGASPKKNRR